ncbi:MAG: ABC transporter permease [Planctomycetota bacterium]
MYRFILAWRYLRSRKITYLSVLGVAVGVTALIVVLAVMEGFQQDFKRRIRGMLSDIVMRYRGDEPLDEVLRKIESVPHVVGAAPRLRGMGLVGAGKGRGAVGTVGIDPDREGRVSQLPMYVMNAWIDRHAAGAIVYFEMYLFLVRDNLEQLRQLEKEGGLPPELAPHVEKSRLFVTTVESVVQHLHENKGFEAIREAYRRFRNALNASALFGEKFPEIETEIDIHLQRLADQESRYEEAMARAREQGVPPLPFSAPDAREIIVGEELAKRQLHVLVGEKVQMVTGSGKGLPTDGEGRAEGEFEVVGTFKSGMFKFDSRVVFMPLGTAQAFSGREGLVSEIGIRLDDFANAPSVKKALKGYFPDEDIRTWAELRRTLLQAIHLEKAFLAVILFMIVVVAGFNMLATFIMMVTEKTRDLGILMALGGRTGGITAIFLFTCTLIGVIGAGIGTAAGLLIAYHINEIDAFAQSLGVPTPFPRGLYYLERIPVVVEAGQVFWIVAPTILLSILLGGVLPALKAGRLNPLDALRTE